MYFLAHSSSRTSLNHLDFMQIKNELVSFILRYLVILKFYSIAFIFEEKILLYTAIVVEYEMSNYLLCCKFDICANIGI